MSKNGICARCKRPIQNCVAYPYTLCDGNNNHFCMSCAFEAAGKFVMKEDKKLLEELGRL